MKKQEDAGSAGGNILAHKLEIRIRRACSRCGIALEPPSPPGPKHCVLSQVDRYTVRRQLKLHGLNCTTSIHSQPAARRSAPKRYRAAGRFVFRSENMVLIIPTETMTTDQLEDLLREAVIKLTMAEEKSTEMQFTDEYFTLGEPDNEDAWRRDLLILLEIVDPIYDARLEIEHS